MPAPIAPVIATASGLLVLVRSGLPGRDFVGRGRIDLIAGIDRLVLDRVVDRRRRFERGVLLERRGRRSRRVGEHVLGEVEMRSALDRAFALRTALGIDALEGQRESSPLGVDLEDQHGHGVALRDDFARILDVVLCKRTRRT